MARGVTPSIKELRFASRRYNRIAAKRSLREDALCLCAGVSHRDRGIATDCRSSLSSSQTQPGKALVTSIALLNWRRPPQPDLLAFCRSEQDPSLVRQVSEGIP